MIERHSAGNVVPFTRRWWMIDEIDLVRLVAEHERLVRLCDALEACADALPTLPDAETREQLCEMLDDLVGRTEQDASDSPIGVLSDAPDGGLAAALHRRWQYHRMADATHAQDLTAVLRAAGDMAAPSPDALGYMLRCFFTGRRRAMDLEVLSLLSVGGTRLTADARALLVDSLCRRSA